MASLYFELEDSSGDIALEDGTGNLLLEVIAPTLCRYIKISQSEIVDVKLAESKGVVIE